MTKLSRFATDKASVYTVRIPYKECRRASIDEQIDEPLSVYEMALRSLFIESKRVIIQLIKYVKSKL
jgi:hypothetical protein